MAIFSSKYTGSYQTTASFGRVDIDDNVQATSFTGIFEGALSSSAQIADEISGSFTQDSGSFSTRVTDLKSDSGSFSTRITNFSTGNVELVSGSVTSTGSFGHVKIPDDGKISIGNSNDLQLYHNGNHSFIKDGGSGNLILLTSALQVKNATNNKTMIQANQDGAVTLFYDNTQRLVTTPGGLNLTGNITGSGNLKIAGNISSSGNIFGTNLLADSASFSSRITVAEGELENTIISASKQLEQQNQQFKNC